MLILSILIIILLCGIICLLPIMLANEDVGINEYKNDYKKINI